jgi:hypothetical protein
VVGFGTAADGGDDGCDEILNQGRDHGPKGSAPDPSRPGGPRLDSFGPETLVMCMSPSGFQGARLGRLRLERILEILNLKSDWEIRYGIMPGVDRRPSLI